MNTMILVFLPLCGLLDSATLSQPGGIQATHYQQIHHGGVKHEGALGKVLLAGKHCPCRCDSTRPEVAVAVAYHRFDESFRLRLEGGSYTRRIGIRNLGRRAMRVAFCAPLRCT